MPYRLSSFVVRTPALAAASLLLALVLVAEGSAAQVPPTPPARPAPPVPATTPTPTPAMPPMSPISPMSPMSPMPPQPAMAPRAWGQFDSDLFRLDVERAALMAGQAASAGMLRGQAIASEALNRALVAGADAMGAFGQSMSGFGAMAPMAALASGSGSMRSTPPAPWMQSDPADSLYREARRALSNDANQRAAELFLRIRNSFPKSAYTPDAAYWQAFALQRIGGKTELMSALEALELQLEKFPRASTRGDAATLRTRVEGQLARLGDQNAISRLTNRARGVTDDGCARPQDDERIDALNAVAQMDPEQALPILKKVLARREPCTQQLRRTAVWLVASRKQPDAAAILLNVAKTDPDKEVREQAVFWMSAVPTEEATGMLIDLARKSDDIDMQKRAVYALSRSKSPRAATTLREIALDPKAEVELRADAVRWYISGPGRTVDDATSFLKDAYSRADDERFKQDVLNIIGSRRTEESRSFLVDVAQNPKESMDIRRSAIWSLQSSGVTGAQLAQIYDRGTEVEVRKQVISVLANLKDNGGVDKLLDIARNDKNTELKKQALNVLIRSKDPRALALMQEIINR